MSHILLTDHVDILDLLTVTNYIHQNLYVSVFTKTPIYFAQSSTDECKYSYLTTG